MHTEEEARQLWCPFARAIPATILGGVATTVVGVPAHNRVQEHGEHEATWHTSHNCIASACMAWRWAGEGRGYCGLAGKP